VLKRILLVLLFVGLAMAFLLQQRLGEVVSYMTTQEIATSLFGGFTFVILIIGFVMFAAILGALYLVSEGK